MYLEEKRCDPTVTSNTYEHPLQKWIYSLHKHWLSGYHVQDIVQELQGMSEMQNLR